MTYAERRALVDIRGYAAANRVRLTGHAALRMKQRGAQYGDVRHALMTATRCRAQPNELWKVGGGEDLDGDELTLVVAVASGVLIVTVF